MQSAILIFVSTAATGKYSIMHFHFPPFLTGWSNLCPAAADKVRNTLVTKGASRQNTLFIVVLSSSRSVGVGKSSRVRHCCLSFFFNANWPPASDLQLWKRFLPTRNSAEQLTKALWCLITGTKLCVYLWRVFLWKVFLWRLWCGVAETQSYGTFASQRNLAALCL